MIVLVTARLESIRPRRRVTNSVGIDKPTGLLSKSASAV